MFDAILRFSVKKKLFVGLTTLFLLIGGIYSMLTLPIDAVPDITNNQVQIVTVSPTLAPQEVEQLITMPVEIAMSNIMNVTEIRSVSRFGLSVVTVRRYVSYLVEHGEAASTVNYDTGGRPCRLYHATQFIHPPAPQANE